MSEPESYEERAAKLRAGFRERVPEPVVEQLDALIAELERTIVQGAVGVGEPAPDFDLPRAGTQERRSLSDTLADGPVVLSFYRGQW